MGVGDRSELDRRWAAVTAVAFGVIAVCIVAPAPTRAVRDWSSTTIYPWWSLVLAVGGLALAVGSAVVPRVREMGAVPAAVGGVFAAELAGLGIVAVKHWHPAFGMGGGYSGDLHVLQALALLVFAAGVVAATASLVRLVVHGALPRPESQKIRRTAVAVGGAVLVLLPVAIGGGGFGRLDATSLTAFALIYSAPWGISIALTGWLGRTEARAVLAACSLCAAMALVGPQMTDLVGQAFLAFGLALAAVVATLVSRSR
jgi:hypothetical protein